MSAAFERGDRRRGWIAVIILTLIYTTSFVDRLYLALVVDPVMHELQVSDTAIGFLLGAAFAVTYAVAGLPLGRAIDRGNRRMMVAVGVLLWSVLTMASAFAHSFTMLALCRIGVAAGEAVLTPAAISLIGDLFPRERRGIPVAVYSATGSVMTSGALIVGAAVLSIAGPLQTEFGLSTWRLGFLMIGAPGVVLALIFMIVIKEPVRGRWDLTEDGKPVAADDILRPRFIDYLRRHWRLYLPLDLATGVLGMFTLGMFSWAPTMIIRTHNITAAQAGFYLGAIGIPAALVGTFVLPLIVRWLERRKRPAAILRVYLGAVVIALPLMIVAPLATSLIVFLIAYAALKPTLSAISVLPPLAMQAYGPPGLRGQLVALSLLCNNLLGFSLGPLLIALVAARFAPDPHAISYSISIIGGFVGPVVIVLLTLAFWSAARAPEGNGVRQ